MARVLGYGVGNTNGLRDFSGKTEATDEFLFRFRGNDNINHRRRFGGLWQQVMMLCLWFL